MYTDFENIPAQRVALAVGFLREGVARAAVPGRDGGRRDAIVWSRVRDDPPGPTPRFLPDLDGGMLSDGVVLLTPMTAADAAEVHPVRAARSVVRWTVTRQTPNAAETAQYCARAAAAWLEDRSVRLTVRDRATGQFVGKVGLSVEDADIGQAEIDYYLGSQWRGRGYATRAVRLLCDWAFRHTGLVRLVAGVHPPNVASQRVLARVGFVHEGHEVARLPDGAGGRTDVYTYVRLRVPAGPAAAAALSVPW
jgi:RimJ/RimL family protein N-acetyltransferase